MSVFFGQLGGELACFHALQAHFRSVWPERTLQACELAERQAGVAAGQPAGYFPAVQVVYEAEAQRLYALSGYIWTGAGFPLDEPSAREAITEAGLRLSAQGELDLPDEWGGVFSLAAFDLTRREVWLTGDPSGLLPLYYAQYGGGLVFSSYSRPLARAMQTELDPIGVIQATALHYTIGPRTLYRNVYRLKPGECLHYSQARQRLRFSQPRKIYSAIDHYRSPDEAADALWADYLDGARQVTRPEGKYGIMLSGGVDSRLVLVGLHHFQKPLVAVTVGDEDNREVGIAQRVAQLAGAESVRYTPVQDTGPSKERIDRLIDRAEWASFPHMESCAQIMRQRGALSASTGFGGEIFLGGHAFFVFGSKWDERSRFKMAMRRSFGLPIDFSWPVSSGNIAMAIDSIRNFSMKAFKSHRSYLQPSWLPYYNQAVELIGDEIAAEIKRLLSNEPATIQQLVERYWLEHYTRDFCRQEFTQFTQLPIALPTLHHTFYRRCSNLDPEQKVDHGIYLRLARRHYGQFARLPTANIPLPLKYPDLILWLARAYRAISDRNAVRRQKMTQGMYRGQRFGWVNHDKWVRQTDFLQRMPDLVLNSIYDQDFLREKTQRISAWQERYYSGQELLGLISTSGMIQGFQL
jgi:asparagine synthetase B (glutamine-hydrolysing)